MVLKSNFIKFILLLAFVVDASSVFSQTEYEPLYNHIDSCIENNKMDGLVEKIEEAIELNSKRQGEINPKKGELINKLGIVYLNLADYNKVVQVTQQALNSVSLASDSIISDSLASIKAKLFNTLGMAYLKQNQYDKAIETFRKASAVIEENKLAEEKLSLAIMNNICSAIFSDTSKDISMMEKEMVLIVESFKKHIDDEYSSLYLSARNNLASVYMATKQYEKAFALYEEVIKDFRDGEMTESWQYVSTIWNYALTLFLSKRTDDALVWHKKCLESIKQLAYRDFLFLSEQERETYWKTHNYRLKHFLNFAILNYMDAEDRRFAAFAYDCELFAKNLLLASTVAKQNAIYRSKNHELITMWQQMKSLRSSSKEHESYELERKLLNSLKIEGITDEFSSDWQAIQKMLDTNEVAIEIINFPMEIEKGKPETYYFGLIIRPDAENPDVIILGKEEWMHIIFEDSEETIKPSYNLLWEAILPYLTNISTLYIAPSGLFNAISFSVFKNPDGKHIAESFNVHNLLSTRDIATVKARKDAASDKKDIVLFGGADYGLPSSVLDSSESMKETEQASSSPLVRGTINHLLKKRGQGYDFLPGSLAEVQTIEKIASAAKWNVSLFTDNKATEARLKSYSGRSPKVLHISTHGFYYSQPDEESLPNATQLQGNNFSRSAEPMMRSGLLLSGANNIWTGKATADMANDGVLTAYEIANLDLSNTELVVLSACETGLGDIDYNEGIYGLQRAFRLAGVQAMIISLWKVPDEETSALMTEFYKAWTSEMTMKQAFDKAQLSLQKRYPTDPYKWGGFVLIE